MVTVNARVRVHAVDMTLPGIAASLTAPSSGPPSLSETAASLTVSLLPPPPSPAPRYCCKHECSPALSGAAASLLPPPPLLGYCRKPVLPHPLGTTASLTVSPVSPSAATQCYCSHVCR